MTSGARLAAAVTAWLTTLDPAQTTRAEFPFDSDERFVWDYRPGPRLGLALGEMEATQREAAWAMVDVAMSARAAGEIRAIVALEPILGQIERRAGDGEWTRRDPDKYWFTVFGAPGKTAPWAWRVGGHHIAVELTVVADRVVGSTPSFLGANPAVVPDGPSAGSRTLIGEEILARALLAVLTPEQRRVAIVEPTAPPDILSGNGRHAAVDAIPIGVSYDALDSPGRSAMDGLIRHYLSRAALDVADAEWERIRTAGLEPVTFAWAGPDTPGRGHYYTIRGPQFVIEYDNTQDGGNHIHAVWRDLTNDWGEDLLAAHYRARHG